MYTTTLAAIAAFTYATTCLASPGYLLMNFHKRAVVEEPLVRRQAQSDGSFWGELAPNSNKTEYYINITLGTPPQPMVVLLDTATSDLYVPAITNEDCTKDSELCKGGTFDSGASSSYQLIEEGTLDVFSAKGDWANDTLVIGNSPDIKGQQFGIVMTGGTRTHGVLGLGYDSGASLSAPDGYTPIMTNLVVQDIISRRAFSLYLNGPESDHGSIIFGGIDTTKYTGDLIALPFYMEEALGTPTELMVTLSGVSFTDFTGKKTRLSPEGYAQAALIRPGISKTYLNNEVFEALANGFGATNAGAFYVVACRTADLDGTIDFEFGGPDGPTIKVPINELIGDQVWDSQSFDDPSGGCELQFSPPTLGTVILGENFLRHAYAVFDLDNNVAALAQAAGKNTDSMNIVQWSSDFDVLDASVTASLSGTTLDAAEATQAPAVPTNSVGTISGTNVVLTGSPTFNFGNPTVAVTSGGSAGTTTSSTAAAGNFAAPTAALLGLGLVAGVMGL